jgi:hypothetical protein
VSEVAAGASPAKAKRKGKSSRNTVPAEEKAQLKLPGKKKVGPLIFIP